MKLLLGITELTWCLIWRSKINKLKICGEMYCTSHIYISRTSFKSVCFFPQIWNWRLLMLLFCSFEVEKDYSNQSLFLWILPICQWGSLFDFFALLTFSRTDIGILYQGYSAPSSHVFVVCFCHYLLLKICFHFILCLFFQNKTSCK